MDSQRKPWQSYRGRRKEERGFRQFILPILPYEKRRTNLSTKNETPEKKKPEKKKKYLPFRRTVSNIAFALGFVRKTSLLFLPLYFLVPILLAPSEFFSGSYMLRVIVDGVKAGSDSARIYRYILFAMTFSIATALYSRFFWNLYMPGQEARIRLTIQKLLYRKAATVDLACYETPGFFDKFARALDEAYSRVWKILNTLYLLLWRLFSLAANSFLLFTIDPWLIVFGLFPLLLGFVRRWENILKHEVAVKRKPLDRRIRYVRRTFYLNDYAKEMRIGGMYRSMLNQLHENYLEYREFTKQYGFKRAIARFLQNIGLEVVCILGATLYTVWRAVGVGEANGGISLGDCLIVLNSISTISYSLNSMIQTVADFGEHALFLEDVRSFLALEPQIAEIPDAPEAHGGDLDLNGVCFRYEGAESDTLSDITMHIRKGERIALVGQNGSGKTTLVKLLLRLYDPTAGQIQLDGKDIRDYRLSSYRGSFSTVMQDFKIFSFSVRDNVILRRPQEGDTALAEHALEESGSLEKVRTLEKGMETTLTREFDKRGANLSIGEQQKIALARVFAAARDFVILDEPSSALDPIAEYKMFENMMRATEGKSVIFISHRLSSAVLADRVYLMDHGRIAESGTHHELMQQNGKYAEMFRLQAQNYIAEEVKA